MSSLVFLPDKGVICGSVFAVFFCGPRWFLPFLVGRTLILHGVLPFSILLALSIWGLGLSAFSVGDRRIFVLITKGFIVTFPILTARSGEDGVLLFLPKILAIAVQGCCQLQGRPRPIVQSNKLVDFVHLLVHSDQGWRY